MIDQISPHQKIRDLLMLADDPSTAPEAMDELFRILAAHPEASSFYLERMHLQAACRAHLHLPNSSIAPELTLIARRVNWQRQLRRTALVVVPLFLVCLGVVTWFHPEVFRIAMTGRQPVAQLVNVHPVGHSGQTSPFAPAQKVYAADLLDVGHEILQWEFQSGTRVLIEGPAQVRFIHAHRLWLSHGKVLVDTSRDSTDFTVELDGIEIVDTGTRFGIHVPTGGPAEIHVFQGAVDLTSPTRTQPLPAGRAARLDEHRNVTYVSSASLDQFQKTYPLLEGVQRIEGDVKMVLSPPEDVRRGAWIQSTECLLFHESRTVITDGCDISFCRPGTYHEHSVREQMQLAPGLAVDCFMIHYNTAVNQVQDSRRSGKIVFTNKILGVIVDDGLLDRSDRYFGFPKTIYPTGIEKRGSVEVGDVIELLPDQHTLNFSIQAGSGNLDTIRVLTEVRTP